MMTRMIPGVAALLAGVVAIVPPARADRAFECDEIDGERWYDCLGAVRGRTGMVEELRNRTGHLDDSARWAGRLNYQEAAEPLRALLATPPEDDVPWVLSRIAEALAELGDRSSIGPLIDLARRMQQEDVYQVWEETFQALRRLGGPEVVDYARELARDTTDLSSVWAENAVPEILPVLVDADARDMLPLLTTWTTEQGEAVNEFLYAELMGARIRLGDADLLELARDDLGTPDARVPARPEYYVAAMGGDPRDIPSLVRMASSTSPESREAYNAIDRLAALLDEQERALPEGRDGERRRREIRSARQRLVDGLRGLTEYREDREGFQFEARMLARHHASLARLGDEDSRKRLVELIDDDVETVIPWVAAQHAVALGLDGAREGVEHLVVRGTRSGTSTELWEARRDFVDAVAPVLGADDASWTVMMLDTNGNTRLVVLHHFARLAPPGACAAITAAVAGADDDAIEDALPALTILDDACAERLEKLARSRKAPETARLMSVEVLAMMRSAAVPELIRLLRPQTNLGLHLDRAEQIFARED
jgi:HEAT repeat protein